MDLPMSSLKIRAWRAGPRDTREASAGLRKPAMPSGTYGSVRQGFEFLPPLGVACGP